MGKQGHILIVDDDANWRKELVGTLQKNGFGAEAVANVAEALERLSTTIYHVMVLDIRLQDADPGNTEGIGLLQELDMRGLKDATKVIILSGYGTLEQMRQAFREYEVADFLSKAYLDTDMFLQCIKHVFAHKVNINLALDIQWQMNSTIEHVVSNLEVKGRLVGRNFLLRKQLIDELEDLLCRLFHEAEMILVRPITQGWSGAGVLLIEPFFHGRGKGQGVIVKFGDMHKIRKEAYNFQQYVKQFLVGGRSTAILGQHYTLHLGGTVYSFLGASHDQVVDFAAFYRNANVDQLKEAVDHLFHETCATWYANRQHIQSLDLAKDYQRVLSYPVRKLERILTTELLSVRVNERLTFTSLEGTYTFTNPLPLLTSIGSSFKRFTYTCTTHGDVNPHNLFIDKAGFTWLIDFQATEISHILRDVAMLDSVIRFQLLTAQEAALEERLQMEQVLCNVQRFSEVKRLTGAFSTSNQALAKVYEIVVYLRLLARDLIGRDDDISEYSIALFYNALNTLQISSLEMVQREHALLCASLLADRLGMNKYDHTLDISELQSTRDGKSFRLGMNEYDHTLDISELQSAIDDKSFRNYSQLAEIIIRRIKASNPIVIITPYFEQWTVWEVLLPAIGLDSQIQKAILLLRQKEEDHAVYEYLTKIQGEKNAEVIIVFDIVNNLSSPVRIDSGIIWFHPEDIIEIVETPSKELPGWLGRFIATQLDIKSWIPYRTHGAATDLFFGRDYELRRLISGNLRGGIIIGANRSGKTSLLHRLGERLKQRGLIVVGPITFTGVEGFQSFFERTLIDSPLSLDCPIEMTPELWSSALRAYSKREGKKPVFLLDEVDDLIALDTVKGLILERQMRSLQSDGYSEFYLAGHAKLREAITREGGPLRNFAEEIVLMGLTQAASMSLIQEPMNRFGFCVSNDQALRIFRGTAGVAVLIQEFCSKLLYRHVRLHRHYHQDIKSEIEDAEIEAVEQLPDYLSVIFHHYEYGQEWISMSVMLITAILGEVTRQNITSEFGERGVKMSRDQLDAALEFLVQFGILEEFKAGHYKVLSGYLSDAIKTRDPHALLETKLRIKGRKEEIRND